MVRPSARLRNILIAVTLGGALMGSAPQAFADEVPVPEASASEAPAQTTLGDLLPPGVQLPQLSGVDLASIPIPADPIQPAPAVDLPELPGLNIPVPVPHVDSAHAINQVRGELARHGITTPEVDPALTNQIDQQLKDVLPVYTSPDSPTPSGPGAAAATYAADGPNYQWRSDLQSQIMALHRGPVLHRVEGSWFNAPDIPEESRAAEAAGTSLYGPGTPLFIGPKMICTLGVAGYDSAGRKIGITAGHCGAPGDMVVSADSWKLGPSGTVVYSHPGNDYSVIEFGSNAQISRSYNGVTINELGGVAATGEMLCKMGVATGYTCGVNWQQQGRMITSQVCATAGDSGGPLLAGDRMVGMVSRGILPFYELACHTPLQGPLFMPTVGTSVEDVLADLDANGGVGAGFRLAD
ncbi:hypothetical protein SAMN05660282_00294 [Corynebacterium spheniscorum]|uniref:Trypsin n=2 Tax=Corynebacterium spheniscorum TaxID=185761 RepID=A0A1I2PZN3_9CORY|nr:hypothetical protein SAMN05660282_00294 [Corynebacterium spheniscorum]